MKATVLVLATAVITGCAAPQRVAPRSFSEGPQVGYDHIEATKTDAYTVLMRAQNKIRGWLVFRW